MNDPASANIWGVTLSMEVTLGNVSVLIGIVAAVIGAARYWGQKILATQMRIIRIYDVFLKIARDYHGRTGNSLPAEIVKEYEELYGPPVTRHSEEK